MDPATASPSALDRARAGLLLANLFLACVLTVSGLLLLALYAPGSVLAALHRQAGRALLVTAALSLLLHLAPRLRLAPAALAAGLLAACAAASGSGPLVAWRELAVWAVAVQAGWSVSGYLWLWGDDVRFVVVGGTDLEPSTLVLLLVAHLGAGMVTGVTAAAVVATTRWARWFSLTTPHPPTRPVGTTFRPRRRDAERLAPGLPGTRTASTHPVGRWGPRRGRVAHGEAGCSVASTGPG